MNFKNYIAALISVSMGVAMTSCTEDLGDNYDYKVEKPVDNADYEYLASYGVLKDYTSLPLGASVDAAAYLQGGEITTLINSNFTEVVASYHMKHGGVVSDDGSMNFSTVDKFVAQASEAGLNVYGHTLIWHQGQNAKYLNSLIEDKWVADDDAATVSSMYTPSTFVVTRAEEPTWGDNVIANGDFEGADGGSFFVSNNGAGNAAGEIVADGDGHVYKLTNSAAGENWHAQFGVQFPDTPFVEGEEWMLSFDVKSLNGTAFSGTHIQGSENYDALAGKYYGDIPTTTEWSHVEFPINVDADGVAGGIKIVMGYGHAIDEYYIDNVVVAKKATTGGATTPDDEYESVMLESDFAESNKGVTYDVYNAVAPESFATVDDGGNSVLEIVNVTAGDNWMPQLAILLPSGVSFAEGELWQLKFKVKSLNASVIDGVSFQVAAGGDALSGKYYTFNTTTEWSDVVFDIDVDTEGLATAGKVVLGLGTTADTFTFDDLQFSKKTSVDVPVEPEYEWEDELIANGSFEEAVEVYDTENWLAQVNGQSSGSNYSIVEGADGGNALRMNVDALGANKWDTQFIIKPALDEPFSATDVFKMEFDLKSDNGGTITGAHSQNESYAPVFSSGNLTTSTEWKHYSFIIKNAAGGLNFAMQFGDVIDAFYFDNISFKRAKVSGGHFEPLTPEEKTAKITEAMQKWVTAMISRTKGKVSVWDVVNESIDDANPTSLRTGVGSDDPACFYWQDYLGENYVREVIKTAREAAGDEKLLLFINDYGLEFAHDNNAKCDALIDWIEKWEDDGLTKIDGIGTQMHVSLSLDKTFQSKQEDAVVAMFEKLAATGKLIKISEIDMRVSLGNNEYQKISETTDDQLKAMSEYYKFIVSKYFEIIPTEQQYGITHWSPTDATNDDGAWCAGEPIGLWSTDFARKHAYAGFADALK